MKVKTPTIEEQIKHQQQLLRTIRQDVPMPKFKPNKPTEINKTERITTEKTSKKNTNMTNLKQSKTHQIDAENEMPHTLQGQAEHNKHKEKKNQEMCRDKPQSEDMEKQQHKTLTNYRSNKHHMQRHINNAEITN